ncbi:MAG TPA: FtsX-like permease family protein, partial [Candidatus Krumholzibacterium sp.]|nr:FtsX-like permease family protein [Candidatus Krumholzibacterium sp.]
SDAFTDEYAYLDIFGYVFGLVDLIAVVLSCLGLFGLASYAVERRTREIGIRKVLGASRAGMVRMLMTELLVLVAAANLIGAPLGWLFMDFLFDKGYPHARVPIGIDIFVFAALVTLGSAVLAVASRTLRAASADPVKSIRYE